jgi:hypothetical protein
VARARPVFAGDPGYAQWPHVHRTRTLRVHPLYFRPEQDPRGTCFSLGDHRRRHRGRNRCLGEVLHVILDSLVGDIWWLAPFVDRSYALFTVPAVRSPWWMNFLLHWSFAVELAICFWALLVYRKRLKNRGKIT